MGNAQWESLTSRLEAMSWLAAAACLAVVFTGCAPPFAELQSARLAGPDRIEVTPSYSAVTFSGEGDSERVQHNFGFQVATGVSDRTDLRARYEHITLREADEGSVNAFGFGPKFGLVPDQVAFYLPVGFATGEAFDTSDTFQVHPTLLLTQPVAEVAEVNVSAKALVPITDRDVDDLLAFNLGIGLGPDLARWAVRPELGFLINPGEDGRFRHFSVGLTYYFDRP